MVFECSVTFGPENIVRYQSSDNYGTRKGYKEISEAAAEKGAKTGEGEKSGAGMQKANVTNAGNCKLHREQSEVKQRVGATRNPHGATLVQLPITRRTINL